MSEFILQQHTWKMGEFIGGRYCLYCYTYNIPMVMVRFFVYMSIFEKIPINMVMVKYLPILKQIMKAEA